MTQLHEILLRNTRDPRLSYSENPKSLSHLGLNWYRVVTDGQTDGITVANSTRHLYGRALVML